MAALPVQSCVRHYLILELLFARRHPSGLVDLNLDDGHLAGETHERKSGAYLLPETSTRPHQKGRGVGRG